MLAIPRAAALLKDEVSNSHTTGIRWLCECCTRHSAQLLDTRKPCACGYAAVTAGVIESEIGKKNKCDFERYYGSGSAYLSIADAIQKRMDVPAKVRLCGLVRMNWAREHAMACSVNERPAMSRTARLYQLQCFMTSGSL